MLPEDAPRSRWFHGAWKLGGHDGIGMAEWLGQANFVATTSNILARTAYLRANPFRPYRFNHDYFFLVTAMLENQLQVCPEVLLEYRVHGSNTISTRPEPLMHEMLRMHLDLYRHQAPRLVALAGVAEAVLRLRAQLMGQHLQLPRRPVPGRAGAAGGEVQRG